MSDDFYRRPDISPPPRDRDGARRKALDHFAASEKRDTQVRQEIARQRAATDAKTAKLRALRLAKEEADRIAAANAPPAPPKAGAKKIKATNEG
jgi:hypothetical protein